MAENRLPEGATADKILVLFLHDLRRALQLIHRFRDFRTEQVESQVVGPRFADEFETVARCVSHELVKIEWLIDFTQIIMEKSFVRVFDETIELRPDRVYV